MLLQGEELSPDQDKYVEKILFNTQRQMCIRDSYRCFYIKAVKRINEFFRIVMHFFRSIFIVIVF